MDIDFNNVQDQNLIDDSVIDDISNDTAPPQAVGSVVHPEQTPPVAPVNDINSPQPNPTVPPPAPAPPAPAPAADPAPTPPQPAEAAPPPPPVPSAQEILGQTDAPSETPSEAPSDTPIPEPEMPATDDQSNDDSSTDDNLIPAPDTEVEDAPAVDDANEDPSTDTPSDDDKADDSPPPLGQGSGDDDELLGVKQQALEELSPLVSHLDLPSDKKFDTYMEILRASDDKTLVKPALEAAKAIEDEDKRAQALLDVVNEVNYLTQEQTDKPS